MNFLCDAGNAVFVLLYPVEGGGQVLKVDRPALLQGQVHVEPARCRPHQLHRHLMLLLQSLNQGSIKFLIPLLGGGGLSSL